MRQITVGCVIFISYSYSENSNFCCKKILKNGPTDLHLFVSGTSSVKMHGLVVPSEIQNDTETFVILDCQYSLNHTEKDGMILKWYLNGITIYQWIPPARPQVIEILRFL